MFETGESFVEGVHRFNFEVGYHVCRFECSDFYSRQAQNFCTSCKEMDFLLYHPGRQDLWLIEVKDYRFDARPKVRELVDALCRKVRDTLFLLRTAAVAAPQEYPEEGTSLRNFARMSMRATKLHVVFLIELKSEGMFGGSGLLATIKDLLAREIRFIDPHMVCIPITRSSGVGPWKVTPAMGGEHSARVEKRIRHVQELNLRKKEEKMRQQALERIRAAEEQKVREPMWKRRLAEREAGLPGNHEARRRRRRHFHRREDREEE